MLFVELILYIRVMFTENEPFNDNFPINNPTHFPLPANFNRYSI